MICSICHIDTDNIDSRTTPSVFPVCVPCIDAKVKEMALRDKVEHYNSELVGGEALMTVAEMCDIVNE